MDKEQLKIDNDLIKRTFKGNEILLKTMRDLFFGRKISKEHSKMIKDTFADETIREVTRKRFYSKLGDDSAIGQIADFWIGVPEEKMVGAGIDQMAQIIEPRKNLLAMFETAFKLLVEPEGKKVDVTYNPAKDDELYIGLLTRNKYLNAVEAGLNMLKVIAETKEMTPEEIKEAALKNSSK